MLLMCRYGSCAPRGFSTIREGDELSTSFYNLF
jgi:hypothetical protein